MLLFRPVKQQDLPEVMALSKLAGVGMTTLPPDSSVLSARVDQSLRAFATQQDQPDKGNYLFVLQDLTVRRVVGVTGINAAEIHAPFYSYRLQKVIRTCPTLKQENSHHLLTLVTDQQGKTEICSLFLHPAYRHSGYGRLLSLARFLFMRQFPHCISAQVIADVRGVSDAQGESPFWAAVGKHFFPMSYHQADYLTSVTDKQFITDFMPKQPIYVELLPKAAQAVMGQPHPLAQQALRILEKQGFRYEGYMDIFDAGPTLIAERECIRTIVDSQTVMVAKIIAEMSESRYLLSNRHKDFRACIGELQLIPEGGIISQKVAKALNVVEGQAIQCLALT